MIYQPKIIKTLFISFALISIIAVSITFMVQIYHIENRIISLVKKEVKYYVQSSKHQLNIEDTPFLQLQLLNTKEEVLHSSQVSNLAKILQNLELYKHNVTTKSTDIEKYTLIHDHIQNKFYFKFKIFLQKSDFQGYTRGLYAVSEEEISIIYQSIFSSLLQILLAIFITTLLLYPIIVYLNKGYIKQSKNLLHANLDIMSVLGSAVAKRDNETNAHNYRVALYAIKFAEILSLSKEEMKGLAKGAFLHDIGKIGISDTILLKPDKLSDKEFLLMQQHVQYGIDIISKSNWLEDAKDIVLYHHERYDGEGYLHGLIGKNIPKNARIFMICDVFDAFVSKRPYKGAFSLETSLEMIQERAGSHFDPELVPVFCQFMPSYYKDIVAIKDENTLQEMLNKKLRDMQLFSS